MNLHELTYTTPSSRGYSKIKSVTDPLLFYSIQVNAYNPSLAP